MLDYKLIEALAMVVREGGFEKAAGKLFVTQSAVSQRVKLLEEATGQVLLARTTPPKATRAGQKMLKHYLQVKRLEDDLMGDMDKAPGKSHTTLSVGINADTLATWFLEAVGPFLRANNVLLDIRVDDQEQTHRFLKDGDVLGCVSTREEPMQGCRMDYLGNMNYRMFASPDFAARWFPKGLTREDAQRAPALIFNRKDELHIKLYGKALGKAPYPIPANYVPSAEKFVDFIEAGLGYGMLPDQQSSTPLREGRMIDLAPQCHVPVRLYWHCWNLKSTLLESLTRHLTTRAKSILGG